MKTSEIKEVRLQLLKKNGGLCDLCRQVCYRPVLDHSHISDPNGNGCIRSTICDKCNKILARLENNWRARMTPEELIRWLPLAADYIKRHYKTPSDIIHPKEKSKINQIKGHK